MADTDEKIKEATGLLNLLDWKVVSKILGMAAIAILLITVWVFRADIFLSITKKPAPVSTSVPMLVISDKIQSEITTIVDKTQPILAVQIVTINFQKNIRLETFMSIDNKIVQEIYNRFRNNKVVETPFFDNNKTNNGRILRLIGGEFVCVPYKDSTAYQYAPDAGRVITDVCAIGIPPIYGEFSGIFTIYLREKPSKDFTEQLHWMARDFALRIYEDNKHRDDKKKH